MNGICSVCGDVDSVVLPPLPRRGRGDPCSQALAGPPAGLGVGHRLQPVLAPARGVHDADDRRVRADGELGDGAVGDGERGETQFDFLGFRKMQ